MLLEGGRLGAVLMQFPWSWKNTAKTGNTSRASAPGSGPILSS